MADEYTVTPIKTSIYEYLQKFSVDLLQLFVDKGLITSDEANTFLDAHKLEDTKHTDTTTESVEELVYNFLDDGFGSNDNYKEYKSMQSDLTELRKSVIRRNNILKSTYISNIRSYVTEEVIIATAQLFIDAELITKDDLKAYLDKKGTEINKAVTEIEKNASTSTS